MSDDRIVNIVRLGETDYSEAIERMNLLQNIPNCQSYQTSKTNILCPDIHNIVLRYPF